MKTVAIIVALFPLAVVGRAQPNPTSDPLEEFQKSLAKLADFSPDPCGPPFGEEKNWHSSDVESAIFEAASQIVTTALNANPGSPQGNALEALKKLEQMSAELNAPWPEENRFHFEILDLPPALILKVGVRTHERFFAFAIPEDGPRKPNRLWQTIGSDYGRIDGEVPHVALGLYPLHRASSGNPRFLSEYGSYGCAGSTGISYDALEWKGKSFGGFERIIKIDGSQGLDDEVPGFKQIGKLRTEGARITLPYCWFSRVDTWDNPSLCAVDTYDLSGDNVRFLSRSYNRPDLVPVAKVIEYAEQRDYRALLGYCASPQIASALVRDIPVDFFADSLRATKTGDGKKRIVMGFDPIYRFDVEKRAGQWVVVAFRVH